MRFETTQKRNPYRLTIRQHTFPRASIARFANSSRRVQVHWIKTNKLFLAAPDNEVFCAKRVWDQRAEDGFARQIERPFQILADEIVAGTVSVIADCEKKAINSFFALCLIRAEWKSIRIPNSQIPDAIGFEYPTTKDLQEELESRHVICFGSDRSFPGRSLAGIVMQSRIQQLVDDLEDARWGILRAAKGEFLVGDNFSYGRLVPISPVTCLVSAVANEILSESEVAWFNREAISHSREYYFGRDLVNCPM